MLLACGILFGHPFDTIKTWQQVHKTSELIKKLWKLFGFVMIRIIIAHQVTYKILINSAFKSAMPSISHVDLCESSPETF